jgi:hypothetical protein
MISNQSVEKPLALNSSGKKNVAYSASGKYNFAFPQLSRQRWQLLNDDDVLLVVVLLRLDEGNDENDEADRHGRGPIMEVVVAAGVPVVANDVVHQ